MFHCHLSIKLITLHSQASLEIISPKKNKKKTIHFSGEILRNHKACTEIRSHCNSKQTICLGHKYYCDAIKASDGNISTKCAQETNKPFLWLYLRPSGHFCFPEKTQRKSFKSSPSNVLRSEHSNLQQFTFLMITGLH